MFVVTIQPTLSITQSYPQILFPLRVRLLVKFSGKKRGPRYCDKSKIPPHGSHYSIASISICHMDRILNFDLKMMGGNDGIGTTVGLWYGAKKLQDPRPKLIEAFEF